MENNNIPESKFRKLLFNEITFILTIVSLAVGVTLFIVRNTSDISDEVIILKEKVNKVEGNDLPHINQQLQILQETLNETRLDIRELRTLMKK